MVVHLDRATFPWFLTGSFAAAAHGYLRTTFDFDFVIDPDEASLLAFGRGLPAKEYCVAESAAVDALRRRAMFNVIDQVTRWKFDFAVSQRSDFELNQFDRRDQVEVGGVKVWIASAEDVILSKLVWVRAGNTERQLRDVSGIVDVQRQALDRRYIDAWTGRLGVADLWRRVLAGLPPG